MALEFKEFKDVLKSKLSPLGYFYFSDKETGLIFKNKSKTTCLKIDINISLKRTYQYIQYTTLQNHLVATHKLFLRFSITDVMEIEQLLHELKLFTGGEPCSDKLKLFGANRREQEIDPTLPEATFENHFSEAFDEQSLYALTREFEYYDYEDKRRFIDYLLKTESQSFAIELNGETYHHPCLISKSRYNSQLFKQNSLSAEGYKVFRWSLRGMADKEKFIQELNIFFGCKSKFCSEPNFISLRSLHTFLLAEHQHDSLDYLEQQRKEGKNTFLIVLPTATGKTEIFIEDYHRQRLVNRKLTALILVPRSNLKSQTISRIKSRYNDIKASDCFPIDGNEVCVQTYAYIVRHFTSVSKKAFDYIVVDEAHHAQANGLKRVLEYYQPKSLLGFTATDERLDQRRLEDIFGSYETQMTLKDAIEQGIVPPISVYRLKTNIDLSKVRFNGKDFVKSDLQKTIQIPSRDELIVNLIDDCFYKEIASATKLKQGIVFCVDIKHAKRVAALFNSQGIKTKAVSGRDRKASEEALLQYGEEKLQFLCACDLLNEGWDSPNTSIVVMARPTMSKVVYTQQLGRGTRHSEGKNELIVIDVVDSYGASLQPYSTHSLLQLKTYIPFADVLKSQSEDFYWGNINRELKILSGLYEKERELIPIDLFSMQRRFEDLMNEEKLARELFISTGTVRSWVKKGEIIPDQTYPFGKRILNFFSEESLAKIREEKRLGLHNEVTRYDDFFEFLDEKDYTFSYKIVFLCLMIKLADDRGEVDLSTLTQEYAKFYLSLIENYGRADKDNTPFNKPSFLVESNQVQRSILQNPFEKFERKRFMHHCKDLNYISFDTILWEKFNDKEHLMIVDKMLTDLDKYYSKLNIIITDQIKQVLTSFKLSELRSNESSHAKFQSSIYEFGTNNKGGNLVPIYELDIAAGSFGESWNIEEANYGVDLNQLGIYGNFDNRFFISKIKGQSMEPTIRDGSYCLFRHGVVGSRSNRILIVRKDGYLDPETESSFTIKRYHSEKAINPDTDWEHRFIKLVPDNKNFESIIVTEDDSDSLSVVAEFIQMID